MHSPLTHQSVFLTSRPDHHHPPTPRRPMIAFWGRSNVGKSSLINFLLQRKGLAKSSSTPGKTQLINYFEVDKNHYFVDLPGYGFARVNKNVRASWEKKVQDFLLQAPPSCHLLLLIDGRHPLQPRDQVYLDWLMAGPLSFSLVLTKAGGKAKQAARRHLLTLKELIQKQYPSSSTPLFLSDAKLAQGRESLWAHLMEFLKSQ